MKRSSFAEMECPIARAVDVVGDGWLLLVLRDLLLGFRTFAELEGRLGIAPTTLARKLEELVEAGLVDRSRYSEHPPRDAYVPTSRAEALVPVLVALGDWSNRWLAGKGKEPLVMVDARTNARVRPVLVDASTGNVIGAGTVRLVAGPRASASLKKGLAARAVTLGEPKRG
jgi:DNA-binding HxlR family transcriptional regulator